MFTERKPSHRESLLGRWGLGAAVSQGLGEDGAHGAVLHPSPFQPLTSKGKPGWPLTGCGKVSVPPTAWKASWAAMCYCSKFREKEGLGRVEGLNQGPGYREEAGAW